MEVTETPEQCRQCYLRSHQEEVSGPNECAATHYGHMSGISMPVWLPLPVQPTPVVANLGKSSTQERPGRDCLQLGGCGKLAREMAEVQSLIGQHGDGGIWTRGEQS